jgi:type II secretory pathway pseudopilin PulG
MWRDVPLRPVGGLPERLGGFTYFTVLILVAIMGVGLAAIGTMWQQAALREKERELLFVGGEFRRAIGSYFERSPGAPQYPRSLEDLLVDKRLPVVARHLRKVYYDPMTATQDWGLVKEPGGGILGVYSKARRRPLKSAGFSEDDKGFAGALTYADWKFVYGAGSPVLAPGTAQQGLPSDVVPADGMSTPVPVAPQAKPLSSREDPAQAARQDNCEAQRAKDAAECEVSNSAGAQGPASASCADAVANRFSNCLDGGTGRSAIGADGG